MANYQFNMDLHQTILNFLQEFSNENNEIRSQAEENLNLLISQNPFEAIDSLFEIINIDPSKNNAYFSMILIKNYLNVKNLNEISINSPDFFQHMKDILLKFATDSRFSLNLNMYLISRLLNNFYLFKGESFPEYVQFLISLLDNSKYRLNSLEIFCGIFSFLEAFFPQIIEKCDLFDQDDDYRSKSFCFYIVCITYESFDFQSFIDSISQQMPQIFNNMPDKQFCKCIGWTYNLYKINDKYKSLSFFFSSFLYLIMPRLIDPNRDELSKVNLIHHINEMFSSTYLFDFIAQNEIQTHFLDALSNSASDPIRYKDLYNECDQIIQKIYDYFNVSRKSIMNHPHRRNFFFLFKEMENSSNLFVSSLFAKNSIELSNIEKSVEYSTIEDDQHYSRSLIRHNGLTLLKKIIKKFNQFISEEKKIELFEILINLYYTYEEEKIINTLAALVSFFTKEMIKFKRNDIISLCEKKITPSIICCASYFCLIPDSEESTVLANSLFQATMNLMVHDANSLSMVLSYLAKIINTAGKDSTYKFLEQVMPVIIDDPKCFTNKNLQIIFNFINDYENTSEFGRDIFLKLIEFIQNVDENDLMILENVENLCFSMKKIPFYAHFVPDFGSNYLKEVINIVGKYMDEIDFNIRGISISTIGKLSNFLCSNTDILNEIITKYQNILQNEESIYVIKCILSSFCRIILSIIKVDPECDIDQFIQLYPSLFETSYNQILHIRQRDIIIDCVSIADILNIIKLLLELFNNFLAKNPKLTTKLVLDLFLRHEPNDEDEFYFNSDDFKSFFVKIWTTLVDIVDPEILSDDCPKIIQTLIDYAFNNASNYSTDKINAMSALASFFDKNEMPIELISDFIWNGLIPLLNENKKNIKVKEEEEDDEEENEIGLIQTIVSSLIITATKYCNDEINFKSAILVVVENLKYLKYANKLTFERLIELISICLSDEEIAPHAATLLTKATNLVQNGRVQKPIVKMICMEFSKKTEIPEIFRSFLQVVSQFLNASESE